MFKVAKGGTITINSFLNSNDRDIARDHLLKTASSQMREAAKIGLQSLYADPKDVLEKYKDFDIVKEMQARKGAKLLWVRARAIDADVVNANGDLFSKEELLKELAAAPNMNGLELASKVSTKKTYTIGNSDAEIKISALDLGIKKNILHNMIPWFQKKYRKEILSHTFHV